MTTTPATVPGRKRRLLTSESCHQSEDDNDEHSNSSDLSGNKQRNSAPSDLASHRPIVSERQQLAVLKQLAAGDESNSSSPTPNAVMTQQRSTKIHRRNEHGEIILHIAARKGDLKQLKKALHDGANVNEEDNAGWTPLHEGIRVSIKFYRLIVRFLVAVTKNQLKAARLLLKSGANSNAPGSEGQTPLIDAVLNNNIMMVELLLNYSADPSVIDLTNVNETMLKTLKRETSTFDLSDNDSLSLSSPITSVDDSEHDEDKIERNTLLSPKATQKKPFQSDPDHSSDSFLNNKTSTMDSDFSRKNPYDFESDDEETIRNPKQRTTSGKSNDSIDLKPQSNLSIDQSLSNDELIQHIHRVPPLKIVLARTVVNKNLDTESNNLSLMDEDSTMEAYALPIIEENDKFLSTIISSTECNSINTKTVTPEKTLSSINDESMRSSELLISDLIQEIIEQIEEQATLTLISADERMIPAEKEGHLKLTTRTLRSHARGKANTSNQSSNDNKRPVSNRRRILNQKSGDDSTEKRSRKQTISERSNNTETSSNSDDQISENLNEKIDRMEDSCASIDEGNSSTRTLKQVHSQPDVGSLPPNKRRLRERNAILLNSIDGFLPANGSTSESTMSTETNTVTRDIPKNGIKQFLNIRQQIDKRHEAMLHDYVVPKFPKDFSETLMAKKNYLLTPSLKSFPITTPASLGIRRFNPPSDLDEHLSDVFVRQEDERYRMKLRHQVEREKLILSHEQEILRLYGNATRSSINQEIPLSYCSLLRDNEVYNDPSVRERHGTLLNNDYTNTELGKRGKNRWSGRSFIKWVEDSNLKYQRLSCEINQRQALEANTLYSMQRMVWTKHLPKEALASSRIHSFLSERYLPKVEINTQFWTQRETSPI
ncbi:unnamed protein product [Adineta ricciae]|uniref:Uncharacterized protein n=1 Tax=Adineta ricciae TaxID=249248 RepID=A0A813TDG7_ADIRI|nr:unnamed protein product [Adineta ricciae]